MTSHIMDAVRETCMLANIRFSALGISRTDREASRDVTRANGASDGAARVVVSRLPGADAHHKAITAVQRNAKEILEKHTMFFDDHGWRLLPNRRFEPLIQEMAGAKLAFERAMDRLAQEAPTIIQKAQANMGGFNVDIPSEAELLNAYSMKTEFRPVPAGDHFKGLPESTARKLAARLEDRIVENVAAAQNDIIGRFVTPVKTFIERMKAYDEREAALAKGEDVGRVGVFRDTAVTNIKDLFNVLSSFNVTGDERIVELGALVEDLALTSPEDLRNSQRVRGAAVQRAQDIASNLESWLVPQS